jgi:DNA-binding CsgD family transcriptional regulator
VTINLLVSGQVPLLLTIWIAEYAGSGNQHMGKSLSNDHKSDGIGICKQDIEYILEKIANTSLLLTEQSSSLAKINHELLELLDRFLLSLFNSYNEEKNIEDSQGLRNEANENISLSKISTWLSNLLYGLKENDKLQQSKTDQIILNDYLERLNRISDILKGSLNQTSSQKHNQSLTGREKKILSMICSGMKTGQIAESLHLSPYTIKTHRRNIRKKLDLVGKQKNLATYFKTKESHTPGK